MQLRFGAHFVPSDIGRLVEQVKLAEDLGFDLIGLGDSQSLFREAYICLAACALSTSRVRLGPMVSNLVTRHLTLSASAAATLDELSGGRAVLGLGTGDSSILNIGARPAGVETLRRAVETLRGLLRGETVATDGGNLHVRWVKRPVPVWVAAEGPRMLRMAGESCDGVMIGTGLTSEIVRDSAARVRAGAEAAGRSPDAVELWAFAKCNVADTYEEAIAGQQMTLAASAHHAFQFTLEGKHIPEDLKPKIRTLVGGYDTGQHEQHGATVNAALPDDLGLTDYLADRFGVMGTPAQCIAKIERIADAGIPNIHFGFFGTDPRIALRRLGEDVIAHFKR